MDLAGSTTPFSCNSPRATLPTESSPGVEGPHWQEAALSLRAGFWIQAERAPATLSVPTAPITSRTARPIPTLRRVAVILPSFGELPMADHQTVVLAGH